MNDLRKTKSQLIAELDELRQHLSINREKKIVDNFSDRKQREMIQSAVYDISNIAVEKISLDTFFRRIHNLIDQLLDAKNFYIVVYDAQNDLMEIPYLIDEFDNSYEGPFKPEGSLTMEVIRKGKPLLINRKEHDRLIVKGKLRLIGEPMASWLGAPLMSNGETFGSLVVVNYSDENAYNDQDKRVLVMAANGIAGVLKRKQVEKATKDQATYVQQNPSLVIRLNYSGKILYSNPMATELFKQELAGKSVYSYFKNFNKILIEKVTTSKQVHFEEVLVDNTFHCIVKNETVTKSLYIYGTNISALKATELALAESQKKMKVALGVAEIIQESEAKFRSMWRAMNEGAALHELVFDKAGTAVNYRIMDINLSFETILGIKKEQAIGKLATEIYNTKQAPYLEIYSRVATTGEPFIFETAFEPMKKVFKISVFSPSENKFTTVFSDITKQKTLEQSILEISEHEQHRIGHDLHDGLGQLLTGIAFIAKALSSKLQSKSFPEAKSANQIVDLVNQGITQTYGLARGLYPVILKKDGFVSALTELAVNTQDLYKISCELKTPDNFVLKDENRAIHLYRIAQEAVNNAIKHSGAENILIDLSSFDDKKVLTIKDNGIGISKDFRNNLGMGLQIMEYRAKMINASIKLSKNNGGGTKVECSWQGRN